MSSSWRAALQGAAADGQAHACSTQREGGCAGFFYQKHTNGHEICGFYGPGAMTAAGTLPPATSSALATVNRLRSCLPGCCAR